MLQIGKVAQLRRYRARQAVRYAQLCLIVPPPGKIDPRDPAHCTRPHPIPLPQRRVGQPVGVVDPVRTIGRVVECHQRRPLKVDRDGHMRVAGGFARRRSDRHRTTAHRRDQSRRVDDRDGRVGAQPGNRNPVHHTSALIEHLGGELCGLSHPGEHHRVGCDGDVRGQRSHNRQFRETRDPCRSRRNLHISRADPGDQPGRVHRGHRRVSRCPYKLDPGHYLSVRVDGGCRQTQRIALHDRGRGRADCHGSGHQWIRGRGLRGPVPARVHPGCGQQHDRNGRDQSVASQCSVTLRGLAGPGILAPTPNRHPDLDHSTLTASPATG